jgi:hypothetical protein
MFRRTLVRRLLLAAVLGFSARPAAAQTVFNVTDNTSYSNATQTIFNAFKTSPNTDYVINVNSSFTLTSFPFPLLTPGAHTITVNGNGNTINGGGAFRPFLILSGTTSINNLTVTNGAAIGGNGGVAAAAAWERAAGCSSTPGPT